MTRPKAIFNCKQRELTAVARIGLNTYREQQPALAAFKGKYTTAWGDDLEATIDGLLSIPDFQARNARAEVLKVQLDAKNTEVCEKWQGLKLYIADVPSWKDVQKAMLEAAGWNYYEAAQRGNWDSTMSLIASANVFMNTYSTLLVTPDNMPSTFAGEFATLGTDFNALFDDFEDANQDSEVDTDARLEKYNGLYTLLTGMFADGFHVFRNNTAMQNRFVFTTVLELVRGASTPIKEFEVGPNDKKFVDRLVAKSMVTNVGVESLWVEAGKVETQGPGAVELLPESEMKAPEGSMTVFNNTAEVGKFEARVVVD
jgi:hypothetical protein